jgi:hypothetical protein
VPASIDQRQRDRFIELVVFGLSPNEAARAVEIDERLGEELLSDQDITAAVFRKLLTAPSEEAANLGLSAGGADLQAETDEMLMPLDSDEGNALPEGVFLVYPKPGA